MAGFDTSDAFKGNNDELTAKTSTTNQDKNKRALDGEYIINREVGGYELPSTGGPGAGLIYLIGALLAAFAGAGLVMQRRRRKAA